MEAADDERHLVIDGRRWRRTDPSIPEPLQKQLVSTLMAGRRAVGAAKRADRDDDTADDGGMAAARRQVHDAKVALGERGDPWWEEPTPAGLDDRIAATVMTLLRGRDEDATICPSDAARVVGGEAWRDRMEHVRTIASALADSGVVEVRQSGAPVDADASGPIRIGRGSDFAGGRPR